MYNNCKVGTVHKYVTDTYTYYWTTLYTYIIGVFVIKLKTIEKVY